jgi:hypothetical protein
MIHTLLQELHIRYDRVAEDRYMHWIGLGCVSGEVVSTPQGSVQDLRIAMASALIH